MVSNNSHASHQVRTEGKDNINHIWLVLICSLVNIFISSIQIIPAKMVYICLVTTIQVIPLPACELGSNNKSLNRVVYKINSISIVIIFIVAPNSTQNLQLNLIKRCGNCYRSTDQRKSSNNDWFKEQRTFTEFIINFIKKMLFPSDLMFST